MIKLFMSAMLLMLTLGGISQNTYYWAGGASGSWTGTVWSTTLGGTPATRTPNAADILIFDGSNLGSSATGTVSVTGVTGDTITALRIINGASVTLSGVAGNSIGTNMARAAAVTGVPASTTSTSNIINSTNTTGVYVGSVITGPSGSVVPSGITVVTAVNAGNFTTSLPATATNASATLNVSQPTTLAAVPNVALGVGDILYTNPTSPVIEQITSIINTQTLFTYGSTQYQNSITNAAARRVSPLTLTGSTDALTLAAGCTLNLNSTTPFAIKLAGGAKGYAEGTLLMNANTYSRIIVEADGVAQLEFRNGSIVNTGTMLAPFGSVANANNDNIVFKAGSQVLYGTSSVIPNSIFGAMYPASVVKFEKGSWFVWTGSVTGFSAGTYRILPNLRFNASVTSFSGSTTVADTLHIPAGVSVTTNSTSALALKGDFINEGTFGLTNTSGGLSMVFAGTVPQRFLITGPTGSGTITYTTPSGTGGCFQRLVVGSAATLKLQNGSADLNTYGVTTIWGTLNFGNNVIKNLATALTSALTLRPSNSATGSAVLLHPANNSSTLILDNITNMNPGMLLSGAGVPPNTFIASATSTGNVVITTNPVTLAAGATVTSATDANGANIITANAGGLAASYTLQGTSTYGLGAAPGANYRFEAATTTPFPAAFSTVHAKNISLAANVSSNIPMLTVNGTLDLGSNTLTVPAQDTVWITSGNTVAGASSSNYIALGTNAATGDRGFLRISNLSGNTAFPVGTAGSFLPVNITPAAAGEDYSVNVFTGITNDALPNGTALSAADKAKLVDAVWTINNNFTPTGNATVQFGWPASLEGSSFSTLANNQIGIAQYNNGWGTAAGTGDNTANTVSNSFNSFGAFSVGMSGGALPLKFGAVYAMPLSASQCKVSWLVNAEVNITRYVVEVSQNGFNFTDKGTVQANGSKQYSYTDMDVQSGNTYYRIKAVDADGTVSYSNIVKISTKSAAVLEVYPNPVTDRIIRLTLNNSVQQQYEVRLTDMQGSVIYTTKLQHGSGTGSYQLALPAGISTGAYHLTLVSQNGTLVKTVFVR